MIINLRYIADGQEKRSADLENRDYEFIVEQVNDPSALDIKNQTTTDDEILPAVGTKTLPAVNTESRTRITIRAKKKLTLVTSSIKEPYQYRSGSRIYINGYQSWTDSREYELYEHIHNMNRLPKAIKTRFHFEAYGDTWFLKYHKDNFHSFTFTYVRKPDGNTDFIGSLNDRNAFLIVHHKKREDEMSIRSDCQYKVLEAGDEFILYDFVRYTGETQNVLKRYFAHFGTCTAPPVRGYTSWYLHYQNISEEKMETALKAIGPEHFDLFQIDDGYETFVGDWLDIDPAKFPNGLAPMVEKIHAKGLKAGIWLAPFVCEIKSRLYAEHPDWIFKVNGQPVYAGSNWSGDVVLDLRNRQVQDYLKTCLEYYKNLGFDFFKLDFLYAAAMITSGGYTRAQIMRKSMEALRQILSDRHILGCGVPLSSAFNLVDYCRVGPDVSLKFDDVFYMRAMHRERISTKTTLQNTIYRSCMDGSVFRCDPDVFLLRDDNNYLSKEQREALLMINNLCGAVFMTSDNVGQYDEEKRALLSAAEKLREARLTDINKHGEVITIRYQLNGKDAELKYHRLKGILL